MAVKILSILLICILSFSCTSTIESKGKLCKSYGLLNKETKCDSVEYKKNGGSFLAGLIFIPTIICPVVFWGYRLYKPVKEK